MTKFSKASLRGLRTKQRMEAMHATAPAGVRVVPANDDGRRLLRHPKGGGFPAEGSAEWPDDRFTKRRLADGSVTREAPPEPEGREKERRKPDKGDQPDEPNHAA
ncbi:hypothetical protein [Bradyrhizobium sp. 170]|uniref:hypothetical protein n=1 Tax=Bradyrhizobium sp. 170 TaxID=2782641 RepID=UPI001FFF196F|nr:hypothetical protein [Bradyrhizobium sp. 170]UPK03105.1 hypothetical protein IVB05_37105 [Bradyrhizobium sp. 170]